MERGYICHTLMLAIVAIYACRFVCSTDAFEVEVEEVQSNVRRDVPIEGAPHIRHVRFNFDGNDVNLKLKRNAGFKRDFKIYEHVGRNKKELSIKREEGELYHDTENFAAVRMAGKNRRSLHGVFQHEGQAYSIEAVRRSEGEGVHTVTPVKVPPTEGKNESFVGDEVLIPAEEDITVSIDGVEIPATGEPAPKARRAHDKRSSSSPVKVPPTEGKNESFVGDEVLIPPEEDITVSINGVEIPATGEPAPKTRSAHDKRSSTPPVYDVEVDIVADCSMWRFYLLSASNDATQAAKDLADYITVQVNAADLVYKLIDPAKDGLSMNLFINALHILKSGSACDWTKKHVKAVGADDTKTVINTVNTLEGLEKWGLLTRTSYSTPDHIMLWTRYDLDDQGRSTTYTNGMAYRGGICMAEKARSVVQELGYSTWRIVAHELAHSLGSPHDGDWGADACSRYDSYLMSPQPWPTQTNVGNYYKFSPCTISNLKRHLATDGSIDHQPRTCVTNRVCSDAGADINRDVSKLVGIGFDADAFCGDQATARHGPGFVQDTSEESMNSMCFRMTCKKDTKTIGLSHGAPEGADCGGSTDKWCRSGSCVSKASNPAPSAGGSSSCTPTSITKTAPASCTSDSGLKVTLFSSGVFGCSEMPLRAARLCFSYGQQCCKDCYEAGVI